MLTPRDPLVAQFSTERLLAERLSWEHLDEIRCLHGDPRVMRTLSADGNVLSDEQTRDNLRRGVEHWDREGFGLWVLRDRRTNQFVGRAGLMRYVIDDKPEVGLAYAVLSDFWNRGLATEASLAILDIGFGRLGFGEIASWTLPANGASQRVMEKLGFRFVRDIVFAGLPHRFCRLGVAEWEQERSRRILSPGPRK